MKLKLRFGVFLSALFCFGNLYAQEVDVEKRLSMLGIQLGQQLKPIANYVPAVTVGNMVYLSGHGPAKPEGDNVVGRLGDDLTLEEGKFAARLTGIALLSSLKAEIGDLNKVKRIVKVLGMVNAEPNFTQHPMVINGFSDLMVEVFGESGKHARSAVGVASLPNNIAVEIEMIVELKE
ncbi:RidA family protein [Olivibacter sitiensis]|uniref:RidA family protein n=1 Tax=Olivibacter sitiensis TaxID=376470 RepID=UPI0004213B38|nr:RidA family protein [Olivibacter sitiensis]